MANTESTAVEDANVLPRSDSRPRSEPLEQRRWISLDCLRGVAIVLALYQHFGYFLSFWYMAYIKPFHFTDPAYQSHAQAYREGWVLGVDDASRWFLETLPPWITHLYIVLAGFNIGLKSPKQTQEVLRPRLLVFAGLLYFFTLENFVVAMSFGDAVSIYPLQMWMILLALTNVVYARAGLRGVGFLFLISFARFLLPIDAFVDSLEVKMAHFVHRDWEYNARFEYYLGSASLGVLLGSQLRRGISIRVHSVVFGFCAALMLVCVLFWIPPRLVEREYFQHEHALINSVLGTAGIYLTCIFFVSGFLLIERLSRFPRIPVFYWAGVSSILVFALHRVCFVHITLPIYEWIAAQAHVSMRSSFMIASLHVFSVLFVIAALQKLRVFDVLAAAGRGQSGHQLRDG
jgi:hypothetical protein